MRSRRWLPLAAFLGALVLMRQGVVMLGDQNAAFRHYRAAVDAHGIEPAALFYTESPLALRAEKAVRRSRQ